MMTHRDDRAIARAIGIGLVMTFPAMTMAAIS